MDLKKIEKQLDAELANETTESLTNWINKKRMEDNSKLIGRKMKGFRFDNKEGGLYFFPDMDGCIDNIGKIIDIGGDSALVKFDDGKRFLYPLDQVHEHLIPEETKEKGTLKIEDPSPYDPEAIEEAIDLLNDHIKGAEHFTSYPQDFLRGTAPGTNRDIKELISISERHKQKAERLKKIVEYLEQLKYDQITIK